MRCKSALMRIDALRTGELRTPEHDEVEQHLRKCRSCNDSLSDVDGLAKAVKSLVVAPEESCCQALTDGFEQVGSGAAAVWVGFSDRGIRMIHRGSFDEFHELYSKRYSRTLEQRELPDALRKQVLDAVSGEGVKAPRLDLIAAGDLERKVMDVLLRIPKGEVRTYSWVAEKAGKPAAVRAIANFVARNAVPFVVPCHRVVPLSGGVGKYAFGSGTKRDLLRREGVDVDQLDQLARQGIRLIASRTTHVVCVPTCRGAKQIREENRVPFHDAEEAVASGYRPCRVCQPFS